MSRPYPDYVVANDQLLVGINFDEALPFENYQLGAALQSRNLFLETFTAPFGYDGIMSGYLGPASLTVGAARDFAHWQDVADTVAQAFQELGGRVSNQAATVLQYANTDITPAESDKFTKAAADQSIFSPPTDPLLLWWQTIKKDAKDATTPSGWSWTTIALAGLGALVVIALVSKK